MSLIMMMIVIVMIDDYINLIIRLVLIMDIRGVVALIHESY